MAKESYLVAVIGETKAVITSIFDTTKERAEPACAALFVDTFGEDGTATAFDTGATPNVWIEGRPEYIRSVIAA